jgi:hypothetical protein
MPAQAFLHRVKVAHLGAGRKWGKFYQPVGHAGQYPGSSPAENRGPGAYRPDHRTGVTFPDVVVTPLQYVN